MSSPARLSERDERLVLLHSAFDAAGVAFVVFDRTHVITASQRFREWFAPSPGADDLGTLRAALAPLGETSTTAIDGLQPTCDGAGARTAAARRKPVHYDDGRVMELTLVPFDMTGLPAAQIALFRDISASARRELAYEEQQAFLEKAQAVANIGSWIAELDGSDRLAWSSEMYHITGWPRADSMTRGRAMSDLVHPDDRESVLRARNAALTAGPTFGIEHRILLPDGSVRWVHTRGELVRDANEKPLRMIGTMQDVTERRALEDQLRQSQKLEALGRLASGIAHDINNALTAIIGYSEQAIEALDALPASHPVRQDVHEIQRAARRAEAVTRQLPAFSRKQVLAPRVFQLEDAVLEMGRMLTRAMGPNIAVQTNIEPALPPIYGDRLQIEQAIVNLAVNARDAMAATGGTLTITLRATTVDTASVRRFERMRVGRYVELTVTDNGHGMDNQTLARVFEPFFTTKEPGKGTGLGLAMVYSTVTQSGGFIYVESELQRGTTFRAFFPVSMRRQRPDPLPDGPALTTVDDEHRATILLVEDEPPLLRLVGSALRRDNYEVLMAASGEAAIALMQERGAPVDLLLTDVNMPGINGVTLADRLGRDYPGLRTVFMTGQEPSEELTAMLGPLRRVMSKPFAPSDLRLLVREILSTSA